MNSLNSYLPGVTQLPQDNTTQTSTQTTRTGSPVGSALGVLGDRLSVFAGNPAAGAVPFSGVTSTLPSSIIDTNGVVNAGQLNTTTKKTPTVPPSTVTNNSTASSLLAGTVGGAATPAPTTTTTDNTGTTSTTDNSNSSGATDSDNSRAAIQARILELIGQQGTRATEQANIFGQEGVYGKQTDLVNIQNTLRAKKLAYDKQAQDILNAPGVTREQAQSNLQEFQRQANFDLANLGIQQEAASNNYTNAFNIATARLNAEFEPIDNQIKSLTSYYQLNQNDLSDKEKAQLGAEIQTQKDQRDQLFSAKQDAYKTAIQYGAPADVLKSIGDATTVQDVYNSTSSLINPTGSGGSSTSFGSASALPTSLQPYVSNGPSGGAYINLDKVPAQQKEFAKQQAARAGVAALDTTEVAKVRSIQITNDNLQKMEDSVDKILGSGAIGRITGSLQNYFKNKFQTDPEVSSFNTYRDTAINAIQALAGGSGSGFRLNQSEIDTATSNLPTIYDNIETAKGKLNKVRSFLNEWTQELLPNAPGNSSGAQTGGTVVQTKAGAINTNW